MDEYCDDCTTLLMGRINKNRIGDKIYCKYCAAKYYVELWDDCEIDDLGLANNLHNLLTGNNLI
jgi:hypothetical protein